MVSDEVIQLLDSPCGCKRAKGSHIRNLKK